jgi:hypothetical protein
MRVLNAAVESIRLASLTRWVAALALLLGLCFSEDALAQRSKRGKAKRGARATSSRIVAVLPFDGPNTTRLRTATTKALAKQRRKVRVLPSGRVEDTAEQLDADLTSAQGRMTVAAELSISAFIDGELRKRGKVVELVVRVYNGSTGEVVADATFRGKPPGVERQVRTRLWRKLMKPLAKTQPPSHQAVPVPARVQKPPPAEEQEEESELAEGELDEELDEEVPARRRQDEDEEEVAEDEPAERSGEALVALQLGLRLKILTRDFTYNDDLPDLAPLAKHELYATPALRIEGRWYPAAHFTDGVVANLGLDLYGQMMYPVTAESENVGNFDTTSSAFGIAARFRVPVSAHELGFFAGYGTQSFELADSGLTAAQVPSVAYGSIRLGADARFALSETISAGLHAAYLIVQGFGELGSRPWFPHTSGNGLEFEVRGGYALSKSFELTAALGLTRFAMTLSPELTDPGVTMQGRVAGGLTDQSFNGSAGITWTP